MAGIYKMLFGISEQGSQGPHSLSSPFCQATFTVSRINIYSPKGVQAIEVCLYPRKHQRNKIKDFFCSLLRIRINLN